MANSDGPIIMPAAVVAPGTGCQRQQREQMHPALRQPQIAGLHMTELALDDAEGMLDC